MVRLVPFSENHKNALKQLYINIDLQKQLLGEFDKKKLNFENWLCRRLEGPFFKICINNEDQFLGYVQLVDVNRNNKTAYLGICVSSEARGKGNGNKMLTALIDIAKSELNIRKLLLKVRSDNFPAIRLYERNLFKKVGVLQDEYYDSHAYWNVELYEKIL